MIGWVGGGCTRAAVEQAARRALADGKARLIRVRPRTGAVCDRVMEGVEVHPSSCPSGGTVDVFVEPMLPAPRLIVMGGSPAARALSDLARRIGFAVTVAAPAAEQQGFLDVERKLVAGAHPDRLAGRQQNGRGQPRLRRRPDELRSGRDRGIEGDPARDRDGAGRPAGARSDIDFLINAFMALPEPKILIPIRGGQRGNPIVLPGAERQTILDGGFNFGCRNLIERHPEAIAKIEVPNSHYVQDIDTAAAYATSMQSLGRRTAE